jgi:hypothetical protein
LPRRTWVFLGYAIFVVLLIGLAYVPGYNAAQTGPSDINYYYALTVTVFVKDSATGRGIAGATVIFDGVTQPGTSNVMGMLTVTGVGPGTHTVTASNTAAGYPAPASAVTFYVTRSTSVTVPLTYVGTNTVRVRVYIINTSTPVGSAMVYVDHAYAGTTNTAGQLSLTLRTGPHTFTVVRSGYITNTQTSSLTTVTIYLTPR